MKVGGREEGRGPYPTGAPSPAGYCLCFWTVYLGSIVTFKAFYEYCGVFGVICVRVCGGGSCGGRYWGGK